MLSPPPKRPPANPLDSELFDMVRAEERGFVRFPAPPLAMSRAEPAKLAPARLDARGTPLDAIQIAARVSVVVAVAIVVLSLSTLLR